MKTKITKLTSAEAREVMPTECDALIADHKLVLGAIQMPIPAPDCWPSSYDLQREAQARFGAATIADFEAFDDDETVTWIVVRA